MDYRVSKTRYILIVVTAILLFTAFILVGLNAYQNQHRGGGHSAVSSGSQNANDAYIEGYIAARAKYQTICPLAGADTLSVTGVVVENNGTSLVIKQESLDTDPRVDGVSDDRTVVITGSTNVQTVVEKNPTDLAKEITDLQAKGINTPPSPNTVTTLQASDIHVGQTITVQSTTDVRLEPSITATTITVSP